LKEFYKERIDILKSGESFVLAAIIDSQGSTPRKIGAKMIIKKDGSIIGTVGGGKIEALVIQAGGELFDTKITVQKEYKLQEVDNEGIGMACGGNVSILFEYVNVENNINIETYESIVTSFEKGESSTVQIQSICNQGRLYLFGAGHVSQKLAEMAKEIDFMITVVDDRAEFANRKRFPTADEIIVPQSFENCFVDISIDNNSYIAILTRGHAFDLTVLKQSLRTEAFYIGMIGSRRKRDIVYNSLKEEGFTMEDFIKVHNPIGLEIGAETPEEIAVSISAELIKVRGERIK